MLATKRDKTILRQGSIIIGIILALYFFIISPFLKEGTSILDEELERKADELKRYVMRSGPLPSEDGFVRLDKQRASLKKDLQTLSDFIDPLKVRASDVDTELGLFFIERLHADIKRFSEMATKNNIKIPENLGFGDGLPKDQMVDTLLRQLEIVEFAMESFLKTNHIEFTVIRPLKTINYIEPLSKEICYTELPVQLSVKTDTKTLVQFLLEARNHSPVVSIKELHVKAVDATSGDIEASLVLSAFKIERKEESNNKTM